MKKSKPILLVEDDNVDVMTVKRAFDDLKITNQLVCANDGKEALEYLRNDGNKKPCLILLDLNMPGMNGFGFLTSVKADDTLKKIPVIVLSNSGEVQDKQKTFDSGIVGYIVKPTDYEKFVEAVRTINLYWTLSELPNGDLNNGK